MTALATKLLQLHRPADTVADLLWRLADPSTLTLARTPVSDLVWSEQLLLGVTDRLAHFARLMDRPERVDLATAHREVRAALVTNARTSLATLQVLATDSDADVAAAASRRLDLRQRLLADPADVAVAQQAVDALDAAAFVALYAADAGAALRLLASFEEKELALRGVVIDLLVHSGANAEAVRSSLVGALDAEHEAHIIDAELVSWLVSSESVQAECSRDAIIESLGTKKADLAARLVMRASADAVSVLADSPLYAQRSHPRMPKLPPHAKWIDATMLDAMKASGLPTQALAALTFNSAGELPDATIDEIFIDTASDSPAQAIAFLMGQLTRRPSRDDVKRILPALSDEQSRQLAGTYAKVAVEMEGRLPDVPWRVELLRYLPGLFKGHVDDEDLAGVNRLVSTTLGDNANAWEFALALSSEWEQSLDALLAAAVLA